MTFIFTVPGPAGQMAFEVQQGTSLFFVGANGGGKTRLAVHIEEKAGDEAHRISAHRLLALNPAVPKISEAAALNVLRYGYAGQGTSVGFRNGHRWASKAATNPLNDYDALVQALFAEQANTSLRTHKDARAGKISLPEATNFERLVGIWDRLLPHRTLQISGDDIKVSVAGATEQYPASEMSDGERAIFYLIGQTLTAAANSLIIFDEPELHVHRAILGRLWDEVEAARPDCAMVVISHDLDFVSSRDGQKYVLRSYSPSAGWTIEEVPKDSGFSEDDTTLILGSRKPVLFVEGGKTSLDKAIFRACYPDWTIIPRGSCEEVLHAVVTMRANAALTRVSCAGIVDADDYTDAEIGKLASKGVAVLPVSEIENLFLLPGVIEAILKFEGYNDAALRERHAQISSELHQHASVPKNLTDGVLRYCRRRIDRMLKIVDLSDAKDVNALMTSYLEKTQSLDVESIAQLYLEKIRAATSAKNDSELLKWYDNKGLLSIAAKAKNTTLAMFEQWIVRAMLSKPEHPLREAISEYLPVISPR